MTVITTTQSDAIEAAKNIAKNNETEAGNISCFYFKK